MFDTARIVGIFQDDEHPETIGVGITSEDGNTLLIEEHDPSVLLQMAHRLTMFADEIHTNQNRQTAHVIEKLNSLGPGATIADLVRQDTQRPVAEVISLNTRRGIGDGQ
ncbi:hypothetical protein [Leucobacter chinensis]|uniref:hypothetical protein n=1 Tax=Leucobacter chinensis TaxID=2851010 RepID=UPI001C240974|nr:hypothetical protein [Leucobacter chinensis]